MLWDRDVDLSYWGFANRIILNGWTPGDEYGNFTFAGAGGHSSVDYYIASVHCMTAAKSLHVLEEAGRYGTDHGVPSL